MISDAELRGLLVDCLRLWDVVGRVSAEAEGLVITAGDARCVVERGPSPTRWFLTAGARRRAVPSVPALLSAVRRALGLPAGIRARVGAGAPLV
ncbi:MAG: hypothetical protein NT133_18805 [Alphaproteobacteria bacterium]|nr:hypothetical protein [Alphaproteobacteria bacterium]